MKAIQSQVFFNLAACKVWEDFADFLFQFQVSLCASTHLPTAGLPLG